MAYEDKNDSTSKDKILEKLDKWWTYTLDHPTWETAKKNHIRCFQYVEGDQYTSSEITTLEERGQPATVNNQCAITVNKLNGDLADRKMKIGFHARNGAVDQAVADTLSDIFTYIRQRNKLQYEEQEWATDGFTCGFGVMEVFVEFDEMNQPDIRVQQEDSLVVWPDPDCTRYNWNDEPGGCRFIFRSRYFDADDITAKYPQAKGRLSEMSADAGTATQSTGMDGTVATFKNKYYVDDKRKMFRLIDVEWKEPENETMIIFNDPSGTFPFAVKKSEAKDLLEQAKEANIDFEEIRRVRKVMHRAVFIGGLLLEHKVLKTKHFSLVPYMIYRKKTGEPYGPIYLGLSLQDAINKRESKAVHLMSTNQTIYERGSIPDPDKYQEEIHLPDGLVEVEQGSLSGERVMLRNNIELGAQQFQMHIAAQKDFTAVVGVNPNAAIDTGELRGSAALGRKFTELGKPVAKIFENLSRSRLLLGDTILDFVQNYITPQKVMMITDDEGRASQVALNPNMIQAIKQAQYDVIGTEVQDNATVQQEQFQWFMQFLPNLVSLGPFWVKKVIQMSDLRDKDKHVADLEKTEGPPPNKPRISLQANINELIPEERAAIWQDAGQPQAAQAVMQQRPMTTVETKSATELAKTKIAAEKPEPPKKEKDDDKDPK